MPFKAPWHNLILYFYGFALLIKMGKLSEVSSIGLSLRQPSEENKYFINEVRANIL